MDVGSAEGYYARKLTEFGPVLSIEGSDYVYNEQLRLNEGYDIQLYKLSLNHENIKKFDKVQNMLLLSVLHWFDDPDTFLKIASKNAEIMFIELPSLDCKLSWNQEYLQRIRFEYQTIENYLIKLTDKTIVDHVINYANHVNSNRIVYVLK
jgi:hypothetical protein